MMSSCRAGSAISDARAVETQFGYVRSLAAVTNEHDAMSSWRLKEFARDDLEETIALMRRGYTHDVESDPELSEQRSELEQILENDAGWCWIVRSEDDSSVTGVASYIAMHIEISETPGSLVSELVVDPRHRRKGLAVLMQRHAYARLHECGLEFVFGNIKPGNDTLRRQAEILGRSIWYRSVVFQPIKS